MKHMVVKYLLNVIALHPIDKNAQKQIGNPCETD